MLNEVTFSFFWSLNCFISVQPVPCGDDCRCHYNITQRANVFTCSGLNYTELPTSVPHLTKWLTFSPNSIRQLCGNYQYLHKQTSDVTDVNFFFGNIETICDETLAIILKHSNIKSLNLAHNHLEHIPIMFNRTIGRLQKLWLGQNPVECNCKMMWLISWLNNTRASGQRLVQDYQDVICTGGKWDGIPVYKLSPVKMGCYSKMIPKWIILVSCITSGVILVSVIVIIIIHRKWNAVRWIIYKNFDKLLGDLDRNENIENMEFDSFLSYW